MFVFKFEFLAHWSFLGKTRGRFAFFWTPQRSEFNNFVSGLVAFGNQTFVRAVCLHTVGL